MGWKWGTKSKWYNGHKRKEAKYKLSYDRHGNTHMNCWNTTWTTHSTRWAKRITNGQQQAANKLYIAYELEMLDEYLADEDGRNINEFYEDWFAELAYEIEEFSEPEFYDYDDCYDPYLYDNYGEY